VALKNVFAAGRTIRLRSKTELLVLPSQYGSQSMGCILSLLPKKRGPDRRDRGEALRQAPYLTESSYEARGRENGVRCQRVGSAQVMELMSPSEVLWSKRRCGVVASSSPPSGPTTRSPRGQLPGPVGVIGSISSNSSSASRMEADSRRELIHPLGSGSVRACSTICQDVVRGHEKVRTYGMIGPH